MKEEIKEKIMLVGASIIVIVICMIIFGVGAYMSYQIFGSHYNFLVTVAISVCIAIPFCGIAIYFQEKKPKPLT